MQLQGFNGRPVLYKNVTDCFTQMLRTEGPRSFYRGMMCSYLKVRCACMHTYLLLVCCMACTPAVEASCIACQAV